MFFGKERTIRDDIISVGKKLYSFRLAVARSGNLSARLSDSVILVTATGTNLGTLTDDDLIEVDLASDTSRTNAKVTSEAPLHYLIYKNFPQKVIIHCHPPLINAYFAVYSDVKALTFETRLYLGTIPVVEQDTPTVTKPNLVVDALKNSNLVVIKNHGVIAIADKFRDALYLIEALEDAVRIAAAARLFKKDILDDIDKELKQEFVSDAAYLMFSHEHIQAIVNLVNKDEFIAAKGKEMDLTLQLAIKLDVHNIAYTFTFEKGKITNLSKDENAPFIISAPADVWENVFHGALDPFVATMQGKMKLKGEFAKLSRWYVPFSRLFELFKQVKIK